MKKVLNRYFEVLTVLALLVLISTACAKKQTQETTASTQAATEAGTIAAQTQAATQALETTPAPETTAAPAAFELSEIHDLVSAEAIGEFGNVKIDDFDSLRWIEKKFSTATKLNGWPNCPYDMIIKLTRKDGAVFEVQPATDSCDNMLIGGNDWYCYNDGSSVVLFDLFGLEALAGTVKKREPLPAFRYNGDNGVIKAVTEYYIKNNSIYVPAGAVVLPEIVICKIADDGNGNVTVYGNFNVSSYSRRGDVLFLKSGGNAPGVAYLKKTGDNAYEVVKTETAGDGDDMEKDIKRWSNGDQVLYDRYMESVNMGTEYYKSWKNYWFYNYVKDNKLNFTATQSASWDPEPIEPVEQMPEI